MASLCGREQAPPFSEEDSLCSPFCPPSLPLSLSLFLSCFFFFCDVIRSAKRFARDPRAQSNGREKIKWAILIKIVRSPALFIGAYQFQRDFYRDAGIKIYARRAEMHNSALRRKDCFTVMNAPHYPRTKKRKEKQQKM